MLQWPVPAGACLRLLAARSVATVAAYAGSAVEYSLRSRTWWMPRQQLNLAITEIAGETRHHFAEPVSRHTLRQKGLLLRFRQSQIWESKRASLACCAFPLRPLSGAKWLGLQRPNLTECLAEIVVAALDLLCCSESWRTHAMGNVPSLEGDSHLWKVLGAWLSFGYHRFPQRKVGLMKVLL